MSRPFVNLVVNKLGGNRPAFSLHRIDPASLFRRATGPPKQADPAPAAPTKKLPPSSPLPPAAVSLHSPRTCYSSGPIYFMALNDDVVVAVDHTGNTLLYDGALGAVRATNPMVDPRRSPVSLAVGGGLYAMDVSPGPPPRADYFRAFTYGPSFGGCLPEDWYWRSLPPPPLDYDRYQHDRTSPAAHPCAIGAYAVVRGSEIWVSTAGAGTYAFDTAASRAWSKVGEWALPFRGHARHVPELGLWFGFSESDGQLCAADLAQKSPPVKPCESWEEPPVPEGWIPKASDVLPLGSGRLCVVRLFKVFKRRGRPRPPFFGGVTVDDTVVLTGVEVVREAGPGPGSLRMIKHRSKRYRFGDNDDVKLV